jgi:hypothetical protein
MHSQRIIVTSKGQIHSESFGTLRPEDRESLNLLGAEKERDIAAMFTPAEYAEYQLRVGPTARQLQSRVREFGASREEYETIHALQSVFDTQFGTSAVGLTREQRAARSDAEKQMSSELAAALGLERYADYETLTSTDYRYLKQLTDLLGLPSEIALEASPLHNETTSASREIQRNQDLTPEERTAQLTVLRDTTRQKLKALFGADGLSAYEDSPPGRWVSFIVPPPRATPPN